MINPGGQLATASSSSKGGSSHWLSFATAISDAFKGKFHFTQCNHFHNCLSFVCDQLCTEGGESAQIPALGELAFQQKK